jgi:hypothetical protein
VLAGAMAIDADHAPSELGHEWLRSGGRGRPYPHTALTPLAVLAFSRPAELGLVAHLARDLTDPTTGVKLLWPLSQREYQLPPALYPMAIGALACRSGRSSFV